jgi:hypothetical protein
MRNDEARRGLHLVACVFGATEGRMALGGTLHFLIAIGVSETLEIEGPNVKSGIIQDVAPRNAVEAMGY